MKKQTSILPFLAVAIVSFGISSCAYSDVAADNSTPDKLPATETSEVKAVDSQAFLGVGVVQVPPALAAHLSEVIGKQRGVMVANVTKDSPADQAGLKLHDILITYDKQDVYSPEQLVKLVRNDKPDRSVALGYVREGQLVETTVTLGKSAEQSDSLTTRPEFRIPDRFGLGDFDLRRFGLRPDKNFWSSLAEDPGHWSEFQSMSVTKMDDGKYRAEIKYKGENDNIERIFEGTRDEIKSAVNDDQELPKELKNHLLRALDGRPNIRDVVPRDFLRSPHAFDNEIFNNRLMRPFSWPDVDF